LIAPGEATSIPLNATARELALIAPTAFRRAVIGTVVALGLDFALRDWLQGTAAIIAPLRNLSTADWQASLEGHIAVAGCGVIAAAVGGILAGAGRPSGILTGLFVGLVSASTLIIPDVLAGRPSSGLTWAAAATILLVTILAAMLGAAGWPAKVDLPMPMLATGSSLASSVALNYAVAQQHANQDSESEHSIAWVRVMIASVLAIAALVTATQSRELLRDNFGNRLRMGIDIPAVTLQLAILPLFLAGTLAGASTRVGLKNGAMAGVVTTGLLLVLSLQQPPPPPVVGWLELWGLAPTLMIWDSFAATAVGLVLFLALAGEVGAQLVWAPGTGRPRGARPSIV
jgi:hypothetical protein